MIRIIKKQERHKGTKGEHYIYRVWYGDEIVYISKTSQPLSDRMRGHFFGHKYYVQLDVHRVTRIDYSKYRTVADMNLYEMYWIITFRPRLNKGSIPSDNLTVTLPNHQWIGYKPRLLDKWKEDFNCKKESSK